MFTSCDLLTAQIGLNTITLNDNTTMGQTLAVITLVTIPVIIIYALLLDGAQSVLVDDNKMQITEELAEKLRAHGDKLILGICVCTTPDAFL